MSKDKRLLPGRRDFARSVSKGLQSMSAAATSQFGHAPVEEIPHKIALTLPDGRLIAQYDLHGDQLTIVPPETAESVLKFVLSNSVQQLQDKVRAAQKQEG